MLLQRLYEHGQTRDDIPPAFYQKTALRYVIDLDEHGKFRYLRTLGDDTNKRGLEKFAPDVVRSSGDRPLLFADHAEYTFGLPRKETEKGATDASRRFYLYRLLVEQCAAETRHPAVQAVAQFLRTYDPGKPPLTLPEQFDVTAKITFMVQLDDEPVWPIDLAEVRSFWAGKMGSNGGDLLLPCLVCGNERPPVASLPVQIQGIPGGQPTGMALYSANAGAFESYGLERSHVAPTCEACGHLIGTTLNILLKDPTHHLKTRGLAYVFWASEPAEFDFSAMLTEARPEGIRHLLTSPWRGKQSAVDITPFYAVALSASNARIVIRDWIETTLAHAHEHLKRYFALQEIVDLFGEPRWFPLWLLNKAFQNTTQKQPEAVPQAEEALLHAVFHGERLPEWLLYQVLRRIKAEHEVRPEQAALIKMVLLSRDTHPVGHMNTETTITTELSEERTIPLVELDLNLTHPAYLCGRLFAQLEAIEHTARGDDSNRVRSYLNTACTAPASVFARLLRGAQHHLRDLSTTNKGAYLRLEQSLQDIQSNLPPQFPRMLLLIDQGTFMLGYYHQKADNSKAARAAWAAKKGASSQPPETGLTPQTK